MDKIQNVKQCFNRIAEINIKGRNFTKLSVNFNTNDELEKVLLLKLRERAVFYFQKKFKRFLDLSETFIFLQNDVKN